MVRRTLIIYHRVDGDGISSAIIAKNYYMSKGQSVDYVGWNYGEGIPRRLYENDYGAITFVDVSFPPEIMKRLADGKKLITYIDHHITSIESSEKEGYSNLPGKREIGRAACELCWEYFYPKKPIPRFIKLLGIYDTWRKTDKDADWDNEVLPLQYAVKNTYGTKIHEWEKDWTELIGDDEFLDYTIDSGINILKYIRNTSEMWVQNYGFQVTVDNKYNGICLISPMFGSICFESVIKNYDLYIVVNRKDEDLYNISIYREPDRIPEFSCGKYLKENYQGGGHDSAAGGKLTLSQFTRLISECKV